MTNNFPLLSLKLTAKALKNGWLEYIGILFSYGGQAYFQGHLLVVSKRVIETSQQKNSLEKHTLRDHYRLLTQFRRDLHTPFLRISVICGRFVGGSPRRPQESKSPDISRTSSTDITSGRHSPNRTSPLMSAVPGIFATKKKSPERLEIVFLAGLLSHSIHVWNISLHLATTVN